MADAPSLGQFSYDPKKDIKQNAPVDPRPVYLWPFGHKDTVPAPVAAAPSVADVSGGIVKPTAQPDAVQKGVEAMRQANSDEAPTLSFPLTGVVTPPERTNTNPADASVFKANHPADEKVTSTPEQRAQASAPPVNGAVTTWLPGGGSVTTYNKGFHPSDAQIAGIPFRDAIPYGQQNLHTPTPINTGVGKINGVDSDVANQRLAAEMKAKGILNPGSDAYSINNQINQAIRDGKPWGNLLTQYDRASNSAPIPSADPNVVTNSDGTTTNKLTGEVMTNAASAPVESTMQKLLNTPTNTPDEARERAAQIAQERLRLYSANPMQQAMDQFEAGHVDRYNNFKAGVDADRNMEAVQGRAHTSDPIYNYQTSQMLAQAAKDKAAANGDADHPEKYLPKQDARYPDSNTSMASQILKNPDMTQAEGIANMMATTPENQLSRTAANQAEPRAEKIAGLQAGTEAKADRAAYMTQRLKDAEEKMNWMQENKVPAPVRIMVNEYDKAINSLENALNRPNANVDPDFQKKETKLKSLYAQRHKYQLEHNIPSVNPYEDEVDTGGTSAQGGNNIPQPVLSDEKKKKANQIFGTA